MSPSRTIMSLVARISPPQMLLLILGLSAGTTWFVAQELDHRIKANTPAPVAAQTPMKARILLCTRNIAEGSIISADDLQVSEVDASKAPIDCATDTIDVIGHPAKFTIPAGATISLHDLAPTQGTIGFQSKLRPGERAIALAVDTNTGVAGFIQPDSHVDVMVQVGNGAETKTRAILSDVRVVAAGTVYKKQPGESVAQPTSNVTVAVSPNEASKLINGMSAGRIYLTLRSEHDRNPVAVTDVSSLFRKQSEQTQIAATPLPVPPPILTQAEPELPRTVSQTKEPPSVHEVELWQGDKKDIAAIRQP